MAEKILGEAVEYEGLKIVPSTGSHADLFRIAAYPKEQDDWKTVRNTAKSLMRRLREKMGTELHSSGLGDIEFTTVRFDEERPLRPDGTPGALSDYCGFHIFINGHPNGRDPQGNTKYRIPMDDASVDARERCLTRVFKEAFAAALEADKSVVASAAPKPKEKKEKVVRNGPAANGQGIQETHIEADASRNGHIDTAASGTGNAAAESPEDIRRAKIMERLVSEGKILPSGGGSSNPGGGVSR